MEKKSRKRTIKVLDYDVEESQLKTSLREVLERRGLRSELVVEDLKALERFPDDPDYFDYANVYKYAFF